MATANYVLIEKVTVGAAGASSISFNSIPQTGYTDLVIKASTRDNTAYDWGSLYLTFNGSSTGYSGIQLSGTGSAAGSSSSSSWGTTYANAGRSTGANTTANTFANTEIYIPNYTSSNYKSFSVDAVSENNATAAFAALVGSLWSNTAAITSISLFSPSQTLQPYSTFYLYGVAKLGTTPAIVPYATGGDTIMTDGTYWYHTFLSSGTFTPAKTLSVDYLVVAGGGGGGGTIGGGGAGGGLRTGTGFSCASGTGITVTVGAGGATTVSGSNSVFSTITSTGGGYGGSIGSDGATGGSGGGGGSGYNGGPGSIWAQGLGAAGNTPSTSPSQGSSGGNGNGIVAQDYVTGGGGGGAGAVGANASNSSGGNGGAGTANSYSGSSVTYAGGGGGGGRGTAGAGGSGVVIVRYAV